MFLTRTYLRTRSISAYLGPQWHAVSRQSGRRCYLSTLAEDTHSDATFHIPVVDFGKFRYATSPAEKKKTASQIVEAFKEVGFVYIKNHGIPDPVVKNAFQMSARYFKLPLSTKRKSLWDNPIANRGYVQPGQERVTQSSNAKEIEELRKKSPDYKESMEIGRDWDPKWKNKWPEESDVPGFKRTMNDFFQTCHDLHMSVMSSIAMGLGMDEQFFISYIDQQYHNLRLLSYFPVDRSLLNQGATRAGAHSDYGSLTFVFQDSIGGLEVQNPHTKQFHPAKPIDGTIVVNVGDLLQLWSNNVFRSTLHRVVVPTPASPQDKYTPTRQSIAFFCNPNSDAVISCLPNCKGDEDKYPVITTEEYIVGRLKDTYTY